MDVLIEVCARGRLNPATHALVVPSDGGGGWTGGGVGSPLAFTASQSLQSLGVTTVRVVAKSQTSKPIDPLSPPVPPAGQPFEVPVLRTLNYAPAPNRRGY